MAPAGTPPLWASTFLSVTCSDTDSPALHTVGAQAVLLLLLLTVIRLTFAGCSVWGWTMWSWRQLCCALHSSLEPSLPLSISYLPCLFTSFSPPECCVSGTGHLTWLSLELSFLCLSFLTSWDFRACNPLLTSLYL